MLNWMAYFPIFIGIRLAAHTEEQELKAKVDGLSTRDLLRDLIRLTLSFEI